MLDKEQQLIDAAMRYHALLDGPEPIGIRGFVATVDPALREELAAYLEQTLAIGEPQEPIVLSPEEHRLAERATEYFHDRLRQRAVTAAPRQTLTGLRQARRLSLGAVAKQLNLPVDLLHHIERGGVRAATIPALLISRLATALRQAEADIHAALAGPPLGTAGTRLSAQDGTEIKAEAAIDFADALAASSATDAQKVEWT